MVPIGIVTQNRAAYLDVTLRSLSACTLPEDVSVTVFDDASTDKHTLEYYQTSKVIVTGHKWPRDKTWRKDLGLSCISDSPQDPVGIKGKLNIRKLGKAPLGVVNASCAAIRRMFDHHSQAEGVILLQDDVIFKEDWYSRLLDTAARVEEYSDLPLGVLAGVKINQKIRFDVTDTPIAKRSGLTAQCLYITRDVYQVLLKSFFGAAHAQRKQFDDRLKQATDKAGYWAGVIYPFVCQHIGVKSLVRPGRRWDRTSKGRVGYYVHPPYALASTVRQFRK